MANLEPLPYLKWFVRDYRANRRVQRMSYVAKGLYRELLDEEWLEGSLANDVAELADICGCPVDVMTTHWPEIAPCFQVIEGRLVNPKLERQRTEVDECRVKRIEAGREGGLKKQKLANANQMPADAKQVPSTCHIEENTQSKAKESLSLIALPAITQPSVDDLEELLHLYPRRVGKAAGLKAVEKAIARLRAGEEGAALSRIAAIDFLTGKVQSFARSPAGNDGEFTPHPGTWFNGKRYLDDETEWWKKGVSHANSNRATTKGIGNINALADFLGGGEDCHQP
jgi:hypothetical protein